MKIKEYRCTECGHVTEVHDKRENEGITTGFCRGWQYQPGEKPHWFEESESCCPCKCTKVFK